MALEPSRPLVILGLDPGIGCTGYGIIREPATVIEFGTLRPPSKAAFAVRLLHLAEKLSALIEQHRPDHCVVENIFFATNARSALVLGHVRGALMVTAMRHGCAVHEYSALQIKKAMTGFGKAEKEQVRAMVRIFLNLHQEKLPIDSSDALAAALCHVQSWRTLATMKALEAGR